MAFRPLNDRHAIQEVAFTIHFARAFNAEEIAALDAAHEQWKEFLPKKDRPTSIIQIALGQQLLHSPVPGIAFSRIKTDGTIDWRLVAEQGVLIVNCLTYTRWNDIWSQARVYFAQALEALVPKDNPIVGAGLQYIDAFVWEGKPEAFDSELLLKRECPYIPESFWSYGPYWHLHQGWFRAEGLAFGGRRLERMHLDSKNQGPQHYIIIDNLLRMDFENAEEPTGFFGGSPAKLDQVFVDLHQRNKQLMGEFLAEDVQERIDLNA